MGNHSITISIRRNDTEAGPFIIVHDQRNNREDSQQLLVRELLCLCLRVQDEFE